MTEQYKINDSRSQDLEWLSTEDFIFVDVEFTDFFYLRFKFFPKDNVLRVR